MTVTLLSGGNNRIDLKSIAVARGFPFACTAFVCCISIEFLEKRRRREFPSSAACQPRVQLLFEINGCCMVLTKQ
jgi:hypothetical protein